MSRIKACDTKPEIRVRSAIHRAGYRFRKNVKHLPGKPDVVMRKYNLIIFIHGCFWHQHKRCQNAGIPKTRTNFWSEKLKKNSVRDIKNVAMLEEQGWKVVVIWECETEKEAQMRSALQERVFSHLVELESK